MPWTFGDYELDPERFQLTRGGALVRLEPQVLSLLIHLVRNRERLVTRDEIVTAVWHGEAASDASIASRVRSARQAVGDDGVRQAMIRTVHGRGYRFVCETAGLTSASNAFNSEPEAPPAGRPSIAILPFKPLAIPPELAILGEAIPHEIIQALSRLRWLAVIARGSSFRFGQSDVDIEQVATALAVRYVLSGVIECHGRAAVVTLEMIDSHMDEVIWADRLTAPLDQLDDLRIRIVTHLVCALEIHIPLNEALRAA